MRQLLWTILGSFLYCILQGQADPTFTTFKGNHYKIPRKISLDHKGYSQEIYGYENLGELEYKEINIPESESSNKFPRTELKQRLCMVLFSEMTIEQDGCYEFNLVSDDGSRLWIDSTQIINNDGNHKFRAKRDSVFIAKGKYKVKLWYMQLFPHLYGFVFNSKYVGEYCDNDILPKQTNYSLNAQVLFDTDSAELSVEGKRSLDSLLHVINNESFKEMIISGHTDSQGSSDYNLTLSQHRANAIRRYFESNFKLNDVVFRSMGIGEQRPIADNLTEEGRQQNRRVEIEIR